MKKIVNPFLIAFFLLLSFSFLYKNEAYADCAYPTIVESVEMFAFNLDRAEVVAFGEVKSVKENTLNLKTKEIGGTYILLDVEKSWMQALPSEILVSIHPYNSFSFEEGKRYLVHMDRSGEIYFTDYCYMIMENPSDAQIQEVDNLLEEFFVPTEKLSLSKEMMLLFLLIPFPDTIEEMIFVTLLFLFCGFFIIWLLIKIIARRKIKRNASKKEEDGEDGKNK